MAKSSDEFVERYEAVPDIARPTFARHQRLLLEECIRHNGLAQPETQRLMDQIAAGLERVDEVNEASVIRRQLSEFARTHVGDEDVASLGHMENLAHNLFWLQQYDEAIELLQHVWEIRCRDLGSNDALSLETEGYLAIALAYSKSFEKSIELHQDLLRRYGERYGVEDQRTVGAAEQLERAKGWAAKGVTPDFPEPN